MLERQSGLPPELEETFEKYVKGARIISEGAKVSTGQTPREEVWAKNKSRLYRYQSSAEKKHPVPILMIYALINRPYILDLMPGNSFIEYLVGEGFDIYLLDWGVPADEDEDLSFEDYIFDYMPRAVKRVLRTSGASEYTLFGYCMGGTMALMHASLFPENLKNLVLLTTPVDFSPEETGLLGLWTSEDRLNPDLFVESLGNIPSEFVDSGMRMLKPVTNYVGAYATMWQYLLDGKPMQTWNAMNKWVSDVTPFPGAAFRQWIRDFYQQNRLAKGELELRGCNLDLSNVTVPLLNIAGKQDHICPLPQSEATMSLVGSEDKELFVLDAGHVGLLTSRDAKKNLWPKVGSWLGERSSIKKS